MKSISLLAVVAGAFALGACGAGDVEEGASDSAEESIEIEESALVGGQPLLTRCDPAFPYYIVDYGGAPLDKCCNDLDSTGAKCTGTLIETRPCPAFRPTKSVIVGHDQCNL